MSDVYGGSDGLRPGRPGERWRNMTSDTWWQLVSSLRAPCHVCLRLHGQLSPRPWPIPLHPHCECEQLAVRPGELAPIEARTPVQTVRRLSAAAREGLLGADVMRLVGAGLVTLEDVVGTDETGWLLLAFTELVRRHRLSVDQLVAAGVGEAAARRAVDGTAGGG